MTILVKGQAARAGTQRLNTHMVMVAAATAIILLIRLTNLDYNTAFVDEAIYLTIGQRILTANFSDNAMQWVTGSYLYPVTAAVAGSVFSSGLMGARVASAFFSTVAAFSVYLMTRRLFDKMSALMAMIVFGFTGASVFVGQLATYDSLGICTQAVGAASLTYGLTESRPRMQRTLLFAASIFFTLSFLSKYIALAFLPVAGLLLLVYGLQIRRQRAFVLFVCFMLPLLFLLLAYTVAYWRDLVIFWSNFMNLTSQSMPRALVFEQILYTLRIPLVLALLGSVAVLLGGKGADQSPRRRVVARATLAVLWMAGTTLLAYHVVTSGMRSMDKHVVYALLFLAPLAGVGLTKLGDALDAGLPAEHSRFVAQAFLAAFLLVAILVWQDQTWMLQHGWPSVAETVDFLRSEPITPETPILAEGGQVYDYYLARGEAEPLLNTWGLHFEYGGERGEPAMLRAVEEGYFQYLILDYYFTPPLSEALATAAQASGYALVHSERTTVRGLQDREIVVEVYRAP